VDISPDALFMALSMYRDKCIKLIFICWRGKAYSTCQ